MKLVSEDMLFRPMEHVYAAVEQASSFLCRVEVEGYTADVVVTSMGLDRVRIWGAKSNDWIGSVR